MKKLLAAIIVLITSVAKGFIVGKASKEYTEAVVIDGISYVMRINDAKQCVVRRTINEEIRESIIDGITFPYAQVCTHYLRRQLKKHQTLESYLDAKYSHVVLTDEEARTAAIPTPVQ